MKIALPRVLPLPAMKRLEQLGDLKVWPDESGLKYEELLAWEIDADIICPWVSDIMDSAFMDAHPRLKLIANCAVGYNNIDLEEAKKRGIAVTNTPGVLTDATADISMALILDVCRRVTEGDRLIRKGGFKGATPTFHLGRSLKGKTLGIYGLGRIGEAVAHRAAPFGLRVIYNNRRPNKDLEKKLGVEYVSFSELLAQSDIISINAPLTEETTHRFTLEEFEAMKPDAFIINTGRGPIIKEEDLAEALSRGLIAGAGIDVFEFEPLINPRLMEMENVVLTPHIGSGDLETRTAMAQLAADNIEAFIEQRPLPNRVV